MKFVLLMYFFDLIELINLLLTFCLEIFETNYTVKAKILLSYSFGMFEVSSIYTCFL